MRFDSPRAFLGPCSFFLTVRNLSVAQGLPKFGHRELRKACKHLISVQRCDLFFSLKLDAIITGGKIKHILLSGMFLVSSFRTLLHSFVL